MKLHEPIDVGRKSIDTILHARESLVHFLPENANIKLEKPKSVIYLPKSFVDLLKSFVDLTKSRIRPLKSSPKKPFNSCKALIDGSSFL